MRVDKLVFFTCAAGVLLSLSPHILRAEILEAMIPSSLYGTLDQTKTKCPAKGCGPTAAVNSYVFLQKKYPTVYDTRLVPSVDPNKPTTEEQARIANLLMTEEFMNTNPLRGTYWSWFVFGKATYIDYTSSTPTTTYRAQSRFDWVGDSGMPHPQPSWVEDNLPNGPTIDFIFGELRDWEDVEIYVDGHYLTVTGIKYDTANLLGTLYYVDPLGGKAGKADIAQGDANDPITILYDGKLVTIDVAVSESPIPEPNIILLMSTGILILTGMRRLAIAR